MLVQQFKSIDEIIEYYRQHPSNSGGGNDAQNGPNQQSSVNPVSSQPKPQPAQPQVQHQQVVAQQPAKIEEKKSQVAESNKITLTFFFKEENDAYYLALENKAKFNHDFVNKIRVHLVEKNRSGTLSDLNVERALKEFYFEAEQRYSGGEGKEPLLPDVFSYNLLPSYIKAQWEPYNINQIFSSNTIFTCKLEVDESKFSKDLIMDEDKIKQDKIGQRQFENFYKYYQLEKGQRIKSFELKQLRDAVEETKKKFFAIDGLLETLGSQMEQFTSEVFSSPKGILFYGPPGTGKSAISLKMCEFLQVKLVTSPMAAGDFNKGIVGDSERMLNNISERAHLIPWETCFMLVDEIDSLAPDRTADSGQGKDSSLLGVFLAVMDGAKATPNLKIFASTNLREKMDSAFLRRMEIQIFLGNPSALARISWIERKSEEALKQLKFYLDKKNLEDNYRKQLEVSKKDIEDFIKNEDQKKDLKKELQQITLNFSADALRKVLERFYHQIMIGKTFDEKTNKSKNNVQDIMKAQVNFTANEMRVRIGKDLVVQIIDQIGEEKEQFDEKFEDLFQAINKGIIYPADLNKNKEIKVRKQELKITRRFIIDLSADMSETLQIETQKILDQEKVQKSGKKLLNMKKDEYDRINRRNNIEDYRELVNKTLDIKHIDQNKGRMKILNCYRALFIHDPNFLPSGTDFDPLDDYNHFIDSIIQGCNNPPNENYCVSLADNYEQLKKVWLQFIIVLATTHLEADTVKLIDANFLYQNNISDDTGASRLIIDTVNQMKEYAKSVVIFDIDSIAGVSKQFQSMQKEISQPTTSAVEDNEGASFSYQKIRSNAMDIALKFGQNLIESDNMFIFYVTKTKMMTLETKNALNFPLTPKEQEFDDEQGSLDLQRRCGRCLLYFTNRDNEEDKCGFHTRELYRVSEFNQIKHEENEKAKKAEKQSLKVEFINDSALQEKCTKYDMVKVIVELLKGAQIGDFKYLCCQKLVFDKGEISCPHIEIKYENIDAIEILTEKNQNQL